MSAIDEFSSLVATLYEATSDPQQWNRFVVQFYQAMGAPGSARPRSFRRLGASPAVLAFVGDPNAVPKSRSQILKDLYQLTPTEARLADLFLQGRELRSASEELKLTYENTRFHLKQIFRKTNTTRQTQLLRLLLTFPA